MKENANPWKGFKSEWKKEPMKTKTKWHNERMTEKKKEEKLEKKKILEEENGRAKNEYRKYKLMKEMTQ